MYLLIDGGTTNTRVICSDGKLFSLCAASHVGAGNNAHLAEFVRETLAAHASKDTVVIASGMIGSKTGLCEIPHLPAPAGIPELHAGIRKIHLPEISPLAIHFIPGVKKQAANADNTDVMRGEETELYGLCENAEADALYLLSGTHTKGIRTDQSGRIADFCTYLSGELLNALHESTLLGNSFAFSDEADTDFLCQGYELCEAVGINRTLFKGRVLDTAFGSSPKQVYSFLLGAVLHDEIKNLAAFGAKKYILGGKKELRDAEKRLLETYFRIQAVCPPEEACTYAAAKGALKIFVNNP